MGEEFIEGEFCEDENCCDCYRTAVDEVDASGCPSHGVSFEFTTPVPYVNPNEELDF